MPKQPRPIPYGQLERDLCNLARDRVRDALFSVLQLAETKEAKFLITLTVVQQAVAMSAGAYSAVYTGRKDDPFEVAKIVLQLAQEASR